MRKQLAYFTVILLTFQGHCVLQTDQEAVKDFKQAPNAQPGKKNILRLIPEGRIRTNICTRSRYGST